MAGKQKVTAKVESGVVEETTPVFALPNKKVKVLPVVKKSWLPKGHEAEFLYKHSVNTFTIPKSAVNGSYVNPLSKEEQDHLEGHPGLSLSAGDLSVHKRENNFWKSIFKPIRLSKDARTLDLSDPMDYITYKVLLTNDDYIAPDAYSSQRKASYKYMIVEEGYEDSKKSSSANIVADAYLEYSKIREDKVALGDILFLLTNQRVSPSSTLIWLQGQIGDFIAANPKRFIEVVNDKDLITRVLITKGLTYNAIQKDGTAYRTMGGDLMGVDLNATIAFLNNKQNGDHRILIETMIARSEGK
tara:strand:+ start:435 stop:1337 length:903 start_codon:yes stop_codon:yes gene_type:complete